jgi:hypothetical protein
MLNTNFRISRGPQNFRLYTYCDPTPTSALVQDGWCVDREHFPMYSCPIANIMFICVLKHPQNAST